MFYYCVTSDRESTLESNLGWGNLRQVDNECEQAEDKPDILLCACGNKNNDDNDDSNVDDGCNAKENFICYHDDANTYVTNNTGQFQSGCLACGGGRHGDTFGRRCIKEDSTNGNDIEQLLDKKEDACTEYNNDKGHLCLCYSDWCNFEVPNTGSSSFSKITAVMLAISVATIAF